MPRRFSAGIRELIERAGYRQGERRPGDVPAYFICFDKWIFRPRTILRFLPAVPGWKDLKGLRKISAFRFFRILRFFQDPQAIPFDLGIMRDQEGKISLFRVNGDSGTKIVFWIDAGGYAREVGMHNHFGRCGVPVLPLLETDSVRQSVRQALVGKFMAPAGSFEPMDEILLAYVRDHARMVPWREYADRFVDLSLDDDCRMILEQVKKIVEEAGIAAVPFLPVHGDISPFNIVRDNGGNIFLIDFDRAFEASAFHDFVYGWMSGMFTREKTVEYIDYIRDFCQYPPGGSAACGLSFFILDNLYYLGKDVAAFSDRRYTRRLIHEAYDLLRRERDAG